MSNKRSQWETLTERAARTAARPIERPRHVLVTEPFGDPSPGLLHRWQRSATGWVGQVMMLDRDGDPALVHIDAQLLKPAECSCCRTA